MGTFFDDLPAGTERSLLCSQDLPSPTQQQTQTRRQPLPRTWHQRPEHLPPHLEFEVI